ncbi:MAG: IS4 family transposase [Aggregatilineales bacterium]
MTTITELGTTLQRLLTTTADLLAETSGFIRRQREITGGGFAQTLVLGGLAAPDATRKQLQHSATQAGMRVSVQGLDQRFTPTAVDFMRALLTEGLSQLVTSEQALVVLPEFNGVYITDCTQLKWSAAGVKVAVRLEIQRGGLQVCLTELTCHDQKAAVVDAPLPVGALHLGDLGFFNLKRFRDWTAAGVYWLSRYKVGTRLYSMDGQPLDLKSVLTGDAPLTIQVRIGHGSAASSAWLVAAPLPAAERLKRQARLREQARLDQRPLSQRQIDLMGWTLYLTNIPHLTFAQAHVLARTRWQIELLFKLWKSHAGVLRSRSADPVRQQSEGYAKLLGILIAHWLLLVAGWQPARLGAVDALRILRTHVPQLRRAFIFVSQFAEGCYWLTLDLKAAPRLAKRRKTPLAFQLWNQFELVPP